MLVDDLTIDGADNGLRIKSDRSRGGLVEKHLYIATSVFGIRGILSYLRRCTPRVPRKPASCVSEDLAHENDTVMTPGAYTFRSGSTLNTNCEVTLDNVFAEDLDQSEIMAGNAEIAIGPGAGNLAPNGSGVLITKSPGANPGTPLACDARFAAYPALSTAPEIAGTAPPEDKTLYVAF